MDPILYILIGVITGGIIAWLIARNYATSLNRKEQDNSLRLYTELEKDYVAYKAVTTTENAGLKSEIDAKLKDIERLQLANENKSAEADELKTRLAGALAKIAANEQSMLEKAKEYEAIRLELKEVQESMSQANRQLAISSANNAALEEKLLTQKKEMEELGRKFNTEFENIANKILETKSEKFTELNKANLKSILEPLGNNIAEFKTKVEEVYIKESKERFSLGEKVKELADLNLRISEEASNLTKALKGESKTQGGWGEMILESILEKSGLVKDREYFIQSQLKDAEGKPLRSDYEGRKMIPDAVVKYPDNRTVIIDSKVSLNAFTRYIDATETADQEKELKSHVNDVKSRINELSAKGYDDYDRALDFVMMFIPSEPAYIAALKGDPDLWNYAYEKRILLLSPTNLITSLKLIVDLWKREYQNRNAMEIAERGSKLYDKFVGFVSNMEAIGEQLGKAQTQYDEAYKKLCTGNDNLVLQATKLKNLGLKPKKELKEEVVNQAALIDDLIEQ